MIELRNVCKSYRINQKTTIVANNLTHAFPANRSVGLLGRNGAGKSTLLKMMAGLMIPDRGEIIKTGSISYPVGFSGSFHPELTGSQNARFVARIYGVDTDDLVSFSRDFSELGHHFDLPFRTYSSGMRSRLAFGVSMGIPFDTYLVDEVASVGDGAFRQKSQKIFQSRMKDAGAIVVSHSMELLKAMCDCGVVLENGRLACYDKIEKAIEHYEYIMKGQRPPWLRR